MKWFFKVLATISAAYLLYLIIFNSGAEMEPIWAIIAIVCWIVSMDKPYKFIFSNKFFIVMVSAVLILFLTIESAIVVNGLKTNVNDKADYIIVLGARVKGEIPSVTLMGRLNKAYKYLYENHETVAILSGGQGSGENISEAEAMRRYLVGKGISEQRLVLENQSKDTQENIVNSFKIINQNNQQASVMIVTSKFHIFRSKMIAQNNGKEVTAIGSDIIIFLIPNYYLREFFAVIREVII